MFNFVVLLLTYPVRENNLTKISWENESKHDDICMWPFNNFKPREGFDLKLQ